jgi:hypothetical protein
VVMYGNGVKILGMTTIQARQLTVQLGLRAEIQLFVFCVAARGATLRSLAAQLPATPARRRSGTTIAVSV